MRRSFARAMCLALMSVSACSGPPRLVARCERVSDAARPLDVENADDWRHLASDAQSAEDLAIRYADTQHLRRFGTYGHGGLIDGGRMRAACMSALFEQVAATHSVPMDAVRRSLEYRPVRFDVLVIASFALLYAFAADRIAKRLHRRFAAGGWPVLTPIFSGASLAFSMLGVMAGAIWSGVAEGTRLGTDHIAYRGGRVPWGQHLDILFASGVALFLMAALFEIRRAPRADDGAESPRDDAGRGLVLR
jgi:hypothetical protein